MIHGVLLVNKKKGGTSHSVVNSLRHIIGQKAVGHAGTLDPMAEGLMLILLGYGTKLSNYLLVNDKRYHFVFCLGIITDTLDKTGKIINKKKVYLNIEQIKQTLKKNIGKISLPVPLFSAVKIKGKKLYEYERKKQTITLPIRKMCFYDLEIKNIKMNTKEENHSYGNEKLAYSEVNPQNEKPCRRLVSCESGNLKVEVELSCSKGSYIRSWVSLIGDQLGTGACLEELTRLYSAPFNIDSAFTIQDVENKLEGEKNITSEEISKKLFPAFIPFSKSLPHIEAVCASKQDEKQLRQGQLSKDLKNTLQEKQKVVNKNKEIQTIRVMDYNNEQMLALLALQPFLSPKFLRVFPSGLS